MTVMDAPDRCGLGIGAEATPAANAVVPHTFGTAHLPREHQFDAWTQWFNPLFDVTRRDAQSEFVAESKVWRLGGVTISKTCGPAVRSERRMSNIRREPVDHWVVTICNAGPTRFLAHTDEIQAPLRVPFVWSMGMPSLCERPEIDRVQVLLPRDGFQHLAQRLDDACGSALDTPLGRLLADYLVGLERLLPHVAEGDLPRVTNAIGAMIDAAIDPSSKRYAAVRDHIALGRLEQARRMIAAHIRSPALDADWLSGALGLSRSNLYRLFAPLGGVEHYISERRLIEAHRLLTDGSNRKTISAISVDLCFSDMSTFGRAFKRMFGYTPSDARCHGHELLLPRLLGHIDDVSGVGRFRDLLREF